ncbi:hypothetical protein EYF80_017956 [Liparis tanakae]|uniref:Uncharacterized protein n=1 Tax=Liparis tanakae TaxID=230148 RepID=A0A4Z2I2T4_9TELE|nr:hypothetical protein EYF80_017956 [Liparis tanakae]
MEMLGLNRDGEHAGKGLGWTVWRKDWTRAAMKPTLASSSAVCWYWGWVRLFGATAAGQAVCGGADWARLSRSSSSATAAMSAPVLRCPL